LRALDRMRRAMPPETVQLQIPFQVLVGAIASLKLEEKCWIWQLLNAEIIQAYFYFFNRIH
jgi:hypothetical protein